MVTTDDPIKCVAFSRIICDLDPEPLSRDGETILRRSQKEM